MIKTVILIASYKELDSLPILLSELSSFINIETKILIVDDSPQDLWEDLKTFCLKSMGSKESQIEFSFSSIKSGRGGAIRRGLEFALLNYPSAAIFLECDADGSHTARDINKMINYNHQTNVLIGSRYLSSSKIIGWPLSRRIFSKILNVLIPLIFDLKISDATNGLRRYDMQSVKIILNYSQRHTGFIYLTEQLLHVSRAKLKIHEVPIEFINRTVGKSTVGVSEIVKSLGGLLDLIIHKQTESN